MSPAALDIRYFLFFDVESVGLHGEGFAVGYVVIQRITDDGPPYGRVVEEGCFACPPEVALGRQEGYLWVKEHVPGLRYNEPSPRHVRASFWQVWRRWSELGAAVLVADCGWPVEARFLAACIDDAPDERAWQGPYPLHDLATLRLACGLDPKGSEDRGDDEPAHDPQGDARKSAREWLACLDVLGGSVESLANR